MTEPAAGYRVPQAGSVYAVPISPIVRQGDSVTSQPQPVPGEVKSAGQYLRQLRDLAAYVLVGATAVFLLVAVIDLIPGSTEQFGYHTQAAFGHFINLETIVFPIAAVVLALVVQPRHPKAQLIVLAAVVEYAVMAVFGVFFGVLFGLINEAAHNGVRSAFEGLLVRVAWLAVFGVAAYAVYLIWRNLFYTPKPKPKPQPEPQQGVYGQPMYGAPGTYPGQPGYGPPQGQPGPAYPPPPPGQQGFAPGTYGQPAPGWNQPPVTMPAPNATTQPVPPTGPPPGPGYPAAPAEPTQVVPTTQADLTETISEDRPEPPRE
jgi:hypothetical protein